ncbi:MAG: tetratricopeptide repeat protein, partial [Gemmataceae bacterium]|nr:tetratricopeptide repeat protein [Gemmataceae bacterium]
RAARADLARDRPEAAAGHLAHALAVWPGSADVHRLAARAARRSGDLDAAGRHLTACQRLEDPPSPETLLEWSLYRVEAGAGGPLEEQLVSRGLDPAHPDAREIREAVARAYLRRLRLIECLALLDTWRADDPGSPVARSLAGQVWTQLGVYGRAAEEFAEAVRLDPGRTADRLRLALALIEEGKAADAAPHLRRVRAERPGDREVAVYLAFALGRARAEGEARALLDGVLAADPDHVPALAGRARLDLDTDRPADAERYARRVLDLAPQNRQAVMVLHQALIAQGREAEADRAKARLLELEEQLKHYYDLANRQIPGRPNDPALLTELGDVLRQMGRPAEAAGWWRRAVEADPRYAPAHRALADYLDAAGRPDEAAEHRRQAGP